MTNDAKITGGIVIGGGLDHCVYITVAQEFDGSASDAKISEAVSWGKVKPEAKKVTVEGDATITLPVIYAALSERLGL